LRCFAILLAHAAQVVGKVWVGWGLGENGRQSLGGRKRARAWQGAEFGYGTSGDGHGEALTLFGAAQYSGDVVSQLALRDNRHGLLS
jgi:hypothetical protein